MDLNEIPNIIKNSYFKLLIDRDINTEDINTLFGLINGCRPRSSNHEYSNKGTIMRDEEGEIQVESFQIVDAIQEYITMMEIPEKNDILKMAIDLYYRADKG